ncbi:MAG: hypothetical protein JST16_08400 [Bdellovibrionales bacterium]|nr:hypothetical protein [Bdellovibrionales bacterium]
MAKIFRATLILVASSLNFTFDAQSKPLDRVPQALTPADVVTHVTQPALLAELDRNSQSPLALANLFVGIHRANNLPMPAPVAPATGRAHGNDLAKFQASYGKFVWQMSADLKRIVAELNTDWETDITKTYNPAAAKTVAGKILRKNGDVMRLFNEKWLSSSSGQFILAGIANRVDRREFEPGTCGEVRFIYRLGYETQMQGQTYASRMPFTLNMVYHYQDDGQNCRTVASAWNLSAGADATPAAAAQRLMNGPLNFSRLTFRQMEINAQIARFPSELENNEGRRFPGQAIYLMRIFELRNGIFAPEKLENTPDVQAILKSPEKQKLLRDFLAQNLRDIDTGAYQIPEALLADVALSYSTLGAERLANQPFDLIFKSDEADKIIKTANFAGKLKFVGSGRGLLERLNTSTCMGCHQASSTAGFHFLGNDRSDFGLKPTEVQMALDGNRLALPFSPHFYAEIARRTAYVADVANGQSPNFFRPHPSAPAASWSGNDQVFAKAQAGMPCPLPNENSLATTEQWACQSGLTCTALVTNAKQSTGLGQCIPPAGNIYAGLSCRKDVIQDNTPALFSPTKDQFAYNVRSFTDRIEKDSQIYNLPEGTLDALHYNCRPAHIGVPMGRVTKACTAAQLSLQGLKLDPTPNEMCAVVGGKGFEEMAKGYFNSKKFAAGISRGMLDTCSATRYCREDYICQEMPDFLAGDRFKVNPAIIQEFRRKKVGFCTPTYFVYQLRLDGHPNPN